MVDLAEKLHRQMVEAVFDPSALSVALADYAEASQALIGEFIVIGARQTLVTATHGGRTRDDIGDVEREYHTINPRVEYLPNYKVGKLTRDQDIISLEEINTNSAYQDALIPQDTAFYCCLTFENTLTSYSGLVAHRSFADGPFTDDEAKTVERLARACKPAFDLANRIDLHNAKTAIGLFGAEQVALVLDRHGRIIDKSAAAEIMFAKRQLQLGHDGSLRFLRPEANEYLQKALRQSNVVGDRFVTQLGMDGDRWIVEVLPRPEVFMSSDSAGSAIVILDPVRSPPPLDAKLCRDAFGLTMAEVDVATRLVKGQDLATIAAGRQVSLGTVRNVIKSLFVKVECNRQAELVAVLSRFRSGSVG